MDKDGPERRRVRHLAKLVLLQVCFDAEYQAIAAGRQTLKQAETLLQRGEIGTGGGLFTDPRLITLIKQPPRFEALPDEELAALLSLSRITAGPQAVGEVRFEGTARASAQSS